MTGSMAGGMAVPASSGFNNGRQHDADEFVHALLNTNKYVSSLLLYKETIISKCILNKGAETRKELSGLIYSLKDCFEIIFCHLEKN